MSLVGPFTTVALCFPCFFCCRRLCSRWPFRTWEAAYDEDSTSGKTKKSSSEEEIPQGSAKQVCGRRLKAKGMVRIVDQRASTCWLNELVRPVICTFRNSLLSKAVASVIAEGEIPTVKLTLLLHATQRSRKTSISRLLVAMAVAEWVREWNHMVAGEIHMDAKDTETEEES